VTANEGPGSPAREESPLPASMVTSKLVSVLAPFLGENMATAAVRAQLQKAGTAGESLRASEVDALIERLGRGLIVFLGRAKSQAVVESMRSAAATVPTKGKQS
jgi:hypothetical protein